MPLSRFPSAPALALALVSATLLAACGGGSGGSGPTNPSPPPTTYSATSGVWKVIRRDQGLTRAQYERALNEMIERLLEEDS